MLCQATQGKRRLLRSFRTSSRAKDAHDLRRSRIFSERRLIHVEPARDFDLNGVDAVARPAPVPGREAAPVGLVVPDAETRRSGRAARRASMSAAAGRWSAPGCRGPRRRAGCSCRRARSGRRWASSAPRARRRRRSAPSCAARVSASAAWYGRWISIEPRLELGGRQRRRRGSARCPSSAARRRRVARGAPRGAADARSPRRRRSRRGSDRRRSATRARRGAWPRPRTTAA